MPVSIPYVFTNGTVAEAAEVNSNFTAVKNFADGLATGVNLDDGAGVGMFWGTDLWGTGLWGTSSEGVEVRSGRNLGLARSVQLLFTGPTNGGWGFDSITYKYNNRKVNG